MKVTVSPLLISALESQADDSNQELRALWRELEKEETRNRDVPKPEEKAGTPEKVRFSYD